ncbi:hypothetical protein BH10BAC3_BH10BAC3_15660 [soil metagenome]
MSAKRKLLLYTTFFLLIIGGFWFFLFKGTDNWKSKLPVLSYVKPFEFINQSGDTITQSNTSGKVYLANYFFVTCRGICPHMNGNVKKLYQEYKNNKELMFLSHTCQPEDDSIQVLAKYADSIGADGNQWQFLTGNKLALYNMARESYHIDDPKNNVGKIEDQFLHSQFLALVDRSGQVRGIYDGLKEKEMKQLNTDIADLLKEQSRTVFVNGIFNNSPGR